MKNIVLFLGLFGCQVCSRGAGPSAWPSEKDTARIPSGTVIAFAPIPVKKSVSTRVFAHLMPWFETKQTNLPSGNWGIHWTMANQDPDKTDSSGRRQIASHYYPLIGPYASGDTCVIEYQLLLMKLSGIDGVLIDWPGTIDLYDYPANAKNAETIISLLSKTGLNYAVVYEDQNVNIAFDKKVITNRIAAAQKDILYLQNRHFSKPGYEKWNGNPILLDFGPQTFMNASDWTAIFSVLKTPPFFFTLWDASQRAGKNARGEFAWINPDNTTSLVRFYSNNYPGIKIGSAYPGFHTFYVSGGWGGPVFLIRSDKPSVGPSASNPFSTQNFEATLDLALHSDARFIQIPTWNDYGEGTMIEPTREYGYSLLTTLQNRLGVNAGQKDLELVDRFYHSRRTHAGNIALQKKLDQVFYLLASLQMDKASALLDSIQTITQKK